MTTRNYAPHVFFLCFLFVLGNAVFTSVSENLTFILISCGLTLALTCGVFFLAPFFCNKKLLSLAFYIAVFIASTIGIFSSFFDYYKFLKEVQLPFINHTILLIVLIFTTVIFSTFCFGAIYKYCLLVGIIGILIIIICFLSGTKNYDFGSIVFSSNTIDFSFKMFIKYFFPITILPFLFCFENKTTSFKPILFSLLFGFATLLITGLQTVLTLGFTHHTHGYLTAVSVISTGSLFSRLNGLVYFLFFICFWAKITICVKAVYCIIKHRFGKNPSSL